ncbi:MAG: tetratricopeptide repeat protein [Fimbriimonadaceae bacterium]|nr:tetratricopeptide repeat protein [Chthonomonadaceae bacterium]MCO5298240.1 tetratricopeptide repeat protein [Fimbriimonadaceae bacterium]
MRLLDERLGVFEGSFEAGAARVVCGGWGVARPHVASVLEELQTRGRVTLVAHARPARWRLNGPRGNPSDSLGRRHAAYYDGFCRRARPHFSGRHQQRWLDRFEHEVPNLRQAIRWSLEHGEADWALGISVASFALWFKRDMATEGLEWTTRSLDAFGDAPDPLRLDGLNAAGMLHTAVGSSSEGRRVLLLALELAWALGEPAAEAAVLSNLGITFRDEGDLDEARKSLSGAIALWRQLGQDGRLANSLVNLSAVLIAQNREREAAPLLAEAETMYNQLDDPWSRAMVGFTLADLAMRNGEMARARAELAESIRTFKHLKDHRGLAVCFKLLSGLEATIGRYRRAAILFGAAESARSAAQVQIAAIELAPLMQTVEEVREILGEEQYDDAWTHGNELALADAVAFALE